MGRGGVLSARGAAEVNAHRADVAGGNRPSVAEILAERALKGKGGVTLDSAGINALLAADRQAYPNRIPWPFSAIDEWISKRTVTGGVVKTR